MHIEKLRMQNFRGFKDVTIDFRSNLAVFIGVNGSGKSSIIDCCALFLSLLATSVRAFQSLHDSEPPNLSENDITNGYDETHNQIVIFFNSKRLILPLTLTRKSAASDIPPLVKLSFEGIVDLVVQDPNYYEPNSELAKTMQEFHQITYDKFRGNPYASLPVLMHYSADRNVYEISLESDKDHQSNQLTAYDQAITKKVNFVSFFIWYRNQEDLENEIRLGDNPNHVDSKLKAIRDAIPLFLPKLSNLRVKRSSPIRMTMFKEETELVISQLSSGEKNLLAMVADIARRLAIANPHLENALEGEGIILIDEIELHLHPQWQRDIIPRLTSTLTNCQFIVTTH